MSEKNGREVLPGFQAAGPWGVFLNRRWAGNLKVQNAFWGETTQSEQCVNTLWGL